MHLFWFHFATKHATHFPLIPGTNTNHVALNLLMSWKTILKTIYRASQCHPSNERVPRERSRESSPRYFGPPELAGKWIKCRLSGFRGARAAGVAAKWAERARGLGISIPRRFIRLTISCRGGARVSRQLAAVSSVARAFLSIAFRAAQNIHLGPSGFFPIADMLAR